tara:strand:+ start:251 stop:490 length:240 start_codon:yes stop_codon:yes gene_type:complete
LSRLISSKPVGLAEVTETLSGEKPTSNGVVFTIKETEFLLRLIFSSQIEGEQLEIGAGVLGKVKELHNNLMEKEVEVNR